MSKKVFEDFFSELQTDMVAVALEYVDGKADKVYVYASKELNLFSFDVFYEINGVYVHKNQLDRVGMDYENSIEIRKKMLKIGLDDLQSLSDLCEKYDRDMPTEIKMVYDVSSGSFEAKYKYDSVYYDIGLSPGEIFIQWFEEVSKG